VKAGLDLFLAPYGVLPTEYECGVIEVMPHTTCLVPCCPSVHLACAPLLACLLFECKRCGTDS
jgi:hypothetical protein